MTGDASVTQAVESLSDFGIGAVVISDDGETIAGILSERDIVRAIHRSGEDVLGQAVREIMTNEVVTCTSQDQVDQLMSVMTTNRFRHMPVVNDGKLAGIISIGDVVASRVSQLEHETEALEQYIHHGR